MAMTETESHPTDDAEFDGASALKTVEEVFPSDEFAWEDYYRSPAEDTHLDHSEEERLDREIRGRRHDEANQAAEIMYGSEVSALEERLVQLEALKSDPSSLHIDRQHQIEQTRAQLDELYEKAEELAGRVENSFDAVRKKAGQRESEMLKGLQELNGRYKGVAVLEGISGGRDATLELVKEFNKLARQGGEFESLSYRDPATGLEIVEKHYHTLREDTLVDPNRIMVERWNAKTGELIHSVLIKTTEATVRPFFRSWQEHLSNDAVELLNQVPTHAAEKLKDTKEAKTSSSEAKIETAAAGSAGGGGDYIASPQLRQTFRELGYSEPKPHQKGRAKSRGFFLDSIPRQ